MGRRAKTCARRYRQSREKMQERERGVYTGGKGEENVRIRPKRRAKEKNQCRKEGRRQGYIREKTEQTIVQNDEGRQYGEKRGKND